LKIQLNLKYVTGERDLPGFKTAAQGEVKTCKAFT